jgi:hypothetical protein
LKIVQKTAIWAGFLHPFSDPMSLSGPIEHICSMGPHFRFSTLFAKNLSPPKYLYIFISPRYFSWRRAAPSSPARASPRPARSAVNLLPPDLCPPTPPSFSGAAATYTAKLYHVGVAHVPLSAIGIQSAAPKSVAKRRQASRKKIIFFYF